MYQIRDDECHVRDEREGRIRPNGDEKTTPGLYGGRLDGVLLVLL